MAKLKQKKVAKAPIESTKQISKGMIFEKSNFTFLIISASVIILGFILMWGKEDVVDVKSTKLTIAPVIVLIGFILAVYSIMKKPTETQASEDNTTKD